MENAFEIILLLILVDTFRFTIYALAALRMTYLLCWENGPLDVFEWLRAKAGIRYTQLRPEDVRVPYTETFLGRLLMCPNCLSAWMSAIALIGFVLHFPLFDIVAFWLAIWAVSLLFFARRGL